MSRFVCDRCDGITYSSLYNVTFPVFENGRYSKRARIDLCANCCLELNSFLKNIKSRKEDADENLLSAKREFLNRVLELNPLTFFYVKDCRLTGIGRFGFELVFDSPKRYQGALANRNKEILKNAALDCGFAYFSIRCGIDFETLINALGKEDA